MVDCESQCGQQMYTVKALSSDTIAQVKDKILDTIYRYVPYSLRPDSTELDLGNIATVLTIFTTTTTTTTTTTDSDTTTKLKITLKAVALRVHISELRDVTCHIMGSHSVSCHPTPVNLTPTRKAGTQFIYVSRSDGRLS